MRKRPYLRRKSLFETLEFRRVLSAPEGIVAPMIVNGTAAPYYPEIGLISMTNDTSISGVCTGTLIDRQHVLTAGHCMEHANYFITTIIGDTRLDGVAYRVIGRERPSNYVNTTKPDPKNPGKMILDRLENDVAILRLETLVRDIVPMPIYRGRPQRDDAIGLFGFGKTGVRNGALMPNGYTRNFGYAYIDQVDPKTYSWVYDSLEESNIAPGDSGGPSIITFDGTNYSLLGVHSYGSIEATKLGARSTDGLASAHIDWIEGILKRDYAQGPSVRVQWMNDVTNSTLTRYNIRLTYTDINGVTQNNLSLPHIALSGPNNYFNSQPKIGMVISSADKTTLTVDYFFEGPGGVWTHRENGWYTVSMLNNGLRDGDGNPVGARKIDGFNVSIPVDSAAPQASGRMPNVTESGGDNYYFLGYYTDNIGIDRSTLGNDDLEVIRTHDGARFTPVLVSPNNGKDDAAMFAVYRFVPPGGKWDPADNGTYVVRTRTGSVLDVNRNPIGAVQIDSFQVNIRSNTVSPFAVLNAPDITTTSNNAKHRFDIVYKDDTGIDVNSVRDDRNEVFVESDIAMAGIATLISATPSSDGRSVRATYEFNSFRTTTAADHGSFFIVSVRTGDGDFVGNVKDVAGNLLQSGVIGSYKVNNRGGNADVSPPRAAVYTERMSIAGALAQSLSVVFEDDDAIMTTSISDDSVFVVGPTGHQFNLKVGGVNYASNSQAVLSRFFMEPPGGVWDPADDGLYKVYARAGGVSDREGNSIVSEDLSVPGTQIGVFEVDVPTVIDRPAPVTATLLASDLLAKADYYDFQVRYENQAGVDISTLDNADVSVRREGSDSSLPVTFMGVDVNSNGASRTATYRVRRAVEQSWGRADNGRYLVELELGEVVSVMGGTALEGAIGTFEIRIPLPSIGLSSTRISEATVAAVVGELTIESATGSLTYHVDDVRFEVIGNSLRLKPNEQLDFETSPTIEINVQASVTGSLEAYAGKFIVTVVDINEPPTGIELSKLSIPEGSLTTIGTVTVRDPDTNQVHAIAVDDQRFVVVDGLLRPRVGSVFDFETEPLITIGLTAFDNGTPPASFTQTFTISVTDSNEPPTDMQLSRLEVSELLNGAEVGQIVVIDPDRQQPNYEFMVGDPRFEVRNGTLKLRDGEMLVLDEAPRVFVQVQAIDPAVFSNIIERVFEIIVKPRDLPPQWDSATFVSAWEGRRYVYTLYASDLEDDPGQLQLQILPERMRPSSC